MRIYLATCVITPSAPNELLLGVRSEVKLAASWALKGKAIPLDDGPREERELARFLSDRWGDDAWFSREHGSFYFKNPDDAYACYSMFTGRGSFLPIRVWLSEATDVARD